MSLGVPTSKPTPPKRPRDPNLSPTNQFLDVRTNGKPARNANLDELGPKAAELRRSPTFGSSDSSVFVPSINTAEQNGDSH
jgi:hypothetical protein